MQFRLLIETHPATTIRELHVERVTGPLDDLTREKIEVLKMDPEVGEGLQFGEPEVGRSSAHESNLKPQERRVRSTSSDWKEQEEVVTQHDNPAAGDRLGAVDRTILARTLQELAPIREGDEDKRSGE